MAEQTLEQVFNDNKNAILKALDLVAIGSMSKEQCRDLIIKAYDIVVKEALEVRAGYRALENVMEANGLETKGGVNSQVFLDFYHFMKQDEAERAKGEQYIFGDPDKPEKKIEESTHNPG